MLPELISLTWVDYERFYGLVAKIVGYSTTRKADDRKLKPETLESFLLAIQSAKDRDSKEIEDIVGGHVSVGFLVYGPKVTLLELANLSALTCTFVNNGAVISGNLIKWRQSSVACCSRSAPEDVRTIFNDIVQQIERVGLGFYWKNYRKAPFYKDAVTNIGSWVLEQKQ